MSSSLPTGWARVMSMDADTGVSSTDWITNDTTPLFWIEAYDAKPGEHVVISWTGGGSTGWHQTQYDPASNRWFYQMTTPLSAGDHTILVAVRDGVSGYRGTSSGQVISIWDMPTSVATIDSYVDDVGLNQGIFPGGTATDDRTLTLKGTVDTDFLADMGRYRPYYSLMLYKDGVRIGQVTNIDQATGTWEYVLDASDPQQFIDHGEQGVFQVQVEDIAGGVGPMSPDFVITVDLNVGVDFLTTSNHTPILTGDFAFELLPGEYVEVSVNGKTYASNAGQVVLDDATGKWQLQIPASDAIPAGVYDVVAILHRSDGSTIVNDNTLDELTIIDLGPPPSPPPPAPPVNVGTGVGSEHEKYTAITLNDQGQWSVATNGALMEHRAIDSYSLSDFEIIRLAALDKKGGQNATFIDINRDGLMDVVINDADGNSGQQIFINQGNDRYYSSQIGAKGPLDQNMAANVKVEYGGVIGLDKTGDGYVDIAYGDARPYGSGSNSWDSQIVINIDGNLTSMVKDRYFTDAKNGANKQQSFNWGNAQAAPEISGVDLNNDGTVDLIFHANYRSSTVKLDNGRPMGTSSNAYRLVVASNNGDGSYRTSQIIDDVFQNNKYDNYGMANATAMTWADFNGDGYMDLFIGRGRAYNSKTGYRGQPHGENESRILFNDGHGNLGSTNVNGVGKTNNIHWMGDNLAGGASLAVDWNGDGKMDVIELPSFGDRNGMSVAGNTGPVNLYTNISNGGAVNFTTSNLLGGNNTIGINGTVNTGPGKAKPTPRPTNESDFVTGAVLADLDWNGALDLMILTRMGSTHTVMNNNVIADGTALHLRIVDAEGINSFFGNSVQLVDSSGKVVAVQIINPQSGNQTNDSTGLVHFYGLDPNETYSVILLRNINGSSADVGGVAQVGSNVIEHVNATWGGLRAGAANQAHILTAESDGNNANAVIGKGIIGTGYNDTFYASKGTDSYDGAGGTRVVQGVDQWSATGGIDIIDFKLAGNQSVTVDLSLTGYQNTGFNTVRLLNIEGVSGGNGNDYLIGNAQDNVLNGRGGDDHFYLSGGGHDTLVYQLIDNTDATGGNGYDRVYDFTIGDVLRNPDADLIDLSDLLVGYQAGSSNLQDFVAVRQNGNDTILSVDLDGAGSGHGFADMVIFTNTSFDLATLINNGQIIV